MNAKGVLAVVTVALGVVWSAPLLGQGGGACGLPYPCEQVPVEECWLFDDPFCAGGDGGPGLYDGCYRCLRKLGSAGLLLDSLCCRGSHCEDYLRQHPDYNISQSRWTQCTDVPQGNMRFCQQHGEPCQ